MDKDKLEKLYEKVEEALLEDDEEKRKNSLVDTLEIIKAELNRPIYKNENLSEVDWLLNIGSETEMAVYYASTDEKLRFIEELLMEMSDRFKILTDGGRWMS